MTDRVDRTTLAAFATVTLIGGSNFVAVRFSNAELAPFWGAAIRFAIASLLLLALARALRLALPRGRALVGALLYGTLGFGAAYGFGYWGLVDAPAALGSVFFALVPLLTLLLAVIHGLERFRARGLIGGAIAAGGVALIFGDQIGAAVPLGSILALLAFALCVSESTVVAKRFPRAHPIATNAVAMLPGVVLLLALALLAGEARALPTQAATWAALLYLVVVGSMLLFVMVLYVLGRWTASAASYSTVLFPVVTAAIGAVLAGETITPAFALGTAVVMLGVYFGALASNRAAPSLAPEGAR